MIIKEPNIPAKSETVSELFTSASAFAYAALAPDIAKAAQTAAARIKAKCRAGQEIIFEIGQELLTIKDKLQHGAFGKWIAAEFDWTDRTAQNYMNAARLHKESETVSALPPKVIYALAAPSVPPEIKNRVLAEIGKGLVPKPDTLLFQINQAKSAAKLAAKVVQAEKRKAQVEAQLNAAQTDSDKADAKRAKRLAARDVTKAKRASEEQAARELREREEERHAEAFVAILKDHLGEHLSKAIEHFEGSSPWRCRDKLRAAAAEHRSQKVTFEDALAA
jgi:hypothetical protein